MNLSHAQHTLLLEGLAQIGLEPASESLAALEMHLALVQKWRSKMNLISIAEERELISHHALDSLVIAPWLHETRQVLDFGTGAGFPGMQLAAVFPDVHFTLLDSRQRRMEFLRMVAVQAGIENISLATARVEQYNGENQACTRWDSAMQKQAKFDTLVVRAVATLTQLVAMTSHLRCKGQRLLAMKGQAPQVELDALLGSYPDQIKSARIEPLGVPGLAAERHLVIIEFTDPPVHE